MAAKRPDTRRRRVTMTDVGEAAGVSQSTVSFVINDRRDVVVAEDTRRRVLQAAAELGYQPNRAAQALRLDQSFLVGIITRGIIAGPYAGRIVAGIQQSVQANDLLCMVVDTTDDPAEGDLAVANLLAQGVMGVVYAGYQPFAIHTSPLLDRTRCLFVNCWPKDNTVAEAVLLADEYGGGRSAARAVFEAGHTEVAFLGGTQGEYACLERHRGFVDAARAAGVDPDRLFQTYGNYQISSGYDTALEAFAHARPTALICGNDRMAAGAILALNHLGLEVPGDVSVIGFDDQPDMANEFRPALTTVALPHFEMGLRAGQLLLAEPGPQATIALPCPLVERESLAAPRAI